MGLFPRFFSRESCSLCGWAIQQKKDRCYLWAPQMSSRNFFFFLTKKSVANCQTSAQLYFAIFQVDHLRFDILKDNANATPVMVKIRERHACHLATCNWRFLQFITFTMKRKKLHCTVSASIQKTNPHWTLSKLLFEPLTLNKGKHHQNTNLKGQNHLQHTSGNKRRNEITP